MTNIIIVGAGGFGREVYHWLQESDLLDTHDLKGFLSNNPDELEAYDIPYPNLGDPNTYVPQTDDRFILAVGDPAVKAALVQTLKAKDAQFIRLIHPKAHVVASAMLGEGVVLCPFSMVCAEASVGDFTMLNIYSSVGHDTVTGTYCTLSPYSTMNGHSTLGARCFLGSHVTVSPGVTLGDNVSVSANTHVRYDVPDAHFVYTPPAQTALLPAKAKAS